MSHELYFYRSRCGKLDIDERPDGSFRIEVEGDYAGVAPQALINVVLEARMQQVIKDEHATLTPEQLRRAGRSLEVLDGTAMKPTIVARSF